MDNNVQPSIIKAEVKPSMKKHNYNVEISYNLEDGVKYAYCTCPRGQVSCHHMAAVLYHAHYHVSPTDVECQWSAPRVKADEGEGIIKLKDVYPLKKQDYKATQRSANSEEVSQFRNALGDTNCVGFSWLLRPEPTPEAVLTITDIEELLQSPEYVAAPAKSKFLLENCTVSKITIVKIEKITRGQFSNPNWHVARKHRLTASKFGMVLSACTRNKFPTSLYKNLAEGYSLLRIAAVQWGRTNEKTGIEEFEAAMNVKVERTGLWLDTSGFLGATPDGLVGTDAVVEVKCPYKYRDAVRLPEVLKDKSYLYHYNDDGDIVINCNHNYYHQVQGQLYLTDRKTCYFVIWTPQHTEIFSVEKDPSWAENLEILRKFYISKYIPYISK